jgi:hypothetical protein
MFCCDLHVSSLGSGIPSLTIALRIHNLPSTIAQLALQAAGNCPTTHGKLHAWKTILSVRVLLAEFLVGLREEQLVGQVDFGHTTRGGQDVQEHVADHAHVKGAPCKPFHALIGKAPALDQGLERGVVRRITQAVVKRFACDERTMGSYAMAL